MAIPSLDKNNVSWISYYDISEHINSINQVNTGNISGSNLTDYNNGVVFDYTNIPTRNSIKIRISDEGWITSHMNIINKDTFELSTNNYSTTNINGPYDIVPWNEYNTNIDIQRNVLERSIYNTLSQLDSWSSDIKDNYNPSDVGLYNYEYNTGNVSVFYNSAINDTYPSSWGDSKFRVSNRSNIKKVYVTGTGRGDNNWGDTCTNNSSYFSINGTYIINDLCNSRDLVYTAVDMTSEISSGNTITLNGSIGYGNTSSESTSIVLWD